MRRCATRCPAIYHNIDDLPWVSVVCHAFVVIGLVRLHVVDCRLCPLQSTQRFSVCTTVLKTLPFFDAQLIGCLTQHFVTEWAAEPAPATQRVLAYACVTLPTRMQHTQIRDAKLVRGLERVCKHFVGRLTASLVGRVCMASWGRQGTDEQRAMSVRLAYSRWTKGLTGWFGSDDQLYMCASIHTYIHTTQLGSHSLSLSPWTVSIIHFMSDRGWGI